MPLQLTQEPIAEPLSLADVKTHLRVDIMDDDALIQALITSVRQYAETITRRAFIAQKWRYVIDSFPGPTLVGIPWGKVFTLPGHAIELEKSRVRAVTAINFLDMTGAQQVMPSTDYVVDYSSEPCRITPVFGKIWPIPMPQIAACSVDFIAGYAAPIVASTASNTITIQGAWETLSVGDPVRFSTSGGVLPAPLATFTDYFIQSVVSPGVYTLSATQGGALLPITNAGAGSNFIGVVPEGIKSWMKIRINTLYEQRSDVAILERGKVEPLPYVDRLLDPYKVVF